VDTSKRNVFSNQGRQVPLGTDGFGPSCRLATQRYQCDGPSVQRRSSYSLGLTMVDLSAPRVPLRKSPNFVCGEMVYGRQPSLSAIQQKPAHPLLVNHRRTVLESVSLPEIDYSFHPRKRCFACGTPRLHILNTREPISEVARFIWSRGARRRRLGARDESLLWIKTHSG
jgi:hypothetical protein